ncbi:MAG: hypothetical protein BAJATHORv1_60067 [Candidatus Thorarchaeota archaeon]|nr:MAG: hypothetical protein BAJATHORv1_60067 [Candidatus Thorarchaeota archaeon]
MVASLERGTCNREVSVLLSNISTRKVVLTGFIVGILLTTYPSIQNFGNPLLHSNPISETSFHPSVVLSSIVIESDADFEMWGFPGNGSSNNPYLIANYTIETDGIAILVRQTEAYFRIENCTVHSNSYGYGTGIYLFQSNNSELKNNTISGFSSGIIASRVESLNVTKNVLTHSLLGLNFSQVEDFSICDNSIIDFDTGILMDQVEPGSIYFNTIDDCTTGIHATHVDDTIISDNIISNCDTGVLLENGEDLILHNNSLSSIIDYGIFTSELDYTDIFSNVITGPNYGLYLSFGNTFNVSFNNISSCTNGIYLRTISMGTIYMNRVTDCSGDGIFLRSSSNDQVANNTVFWNSEVGVYLEGSSSINVTGNEIGWNSIRNAQDSIGTTTLAAINNIWADNAYSDYTGTEDYAIAGNSFSVDSSPHYIGMIQGMDDFSTELGDATLLQWNVSGLRIKNYQLYCDDNLLSSGIFNESEIIFETYSDSVGINEYKLTVTTSSEIQTSDTVFVETVDTTNPNWNSEYDEYIVESGNYFILDVEASDLSGIDYYWINDTSRFNISESGLIMSSAILDLGLYRLTVRAYDPYDNYCEEILSVIIQDTIAPTIEDVGNVTIQENESITLEWISSDRNPASYEIYLNNELVTSQTWNLEQEKIEITFEYLEPGVYSVLVIIYDKGGNSAQDDLLLIVEPVSTPSTSTTTSVTPSTTSSTTPTDNLSTVIVTIGVSGAAIVILLIVFREKIISGPSE